MGTYRVVLRSPSATVIDREIGTATLFGEFIRLQVSSLIVRHLINEGELYHSHVLPRYDTNPRFGREEMNIERVVDSGPVSVDLDDSDSDDRDEPVRYFTLQIRTSPRRFVYRQDFPVSALKESLQHWTIAHDQLPNESNISNWDIQLYAKESEHGQYIVIPIYMIEPDSLVPEILVEPAPLGSKSIEPPNSTSVEIRLEEVPVELQFKPFPPGIYQVYGKPARGDLNIFVTKGLWDSLPPKSVGKLPYGFAGLLVGEPWREEKNRELVVSINGKIALEEITGQLGEVNVGADLWEKMLRVRVERYPQLQIVGWYQYQFVTEQLVLTPEYLRKSFFNRPWHVALIVNAETGAKNVFRFIGGQNVPCKFLRIIN